MVAVLAGTAQAGDWLRFGYDAARSNSVAGSTGITSENVGALLRQQVPLEGVADSSPIYLRGVEIEGETHDAFIVTKNYGMADAIDADTDEKLWVFRPPGYDRWNHSAQITEASPIADPDRSSVYTSSPDGKIHKLSIEDGSENRTAGWPAAVSLDPAHEKIASALNLSGD